MLVYGRQEFHEELGTLLECLYQRASYSRADSLDDLRMLVIQTGQLQQGIEDLAESGNGVEGALLHRIRALAEHSAELFLRTWSSNNAVWEHAGTNTRNCLSELRSEIAAIRAPREQVLSIKVPEGFEYYTLFPEQYCVSTWKWIRDRDGGCQKHCAVLGLRSIGTTLSSLVRAVLLAHGWRVLRLTARPTGHPFARKVNLCSQDLGGIKSALVVDEGPGLSGSSMAAAAQALAQAGVRDISFLPGHPNEPGSAATFETRQWWARVPRYVTELQELRWNGLPLMQSLALRTQAQSVEDLSSGFWRKKAFTNEAQWPAACARFERAKYLCKCRTGACVLWKFIGLGSWWPGGKTAIELTSERQQLLEEQGLVPDVIAHSQGFLGTAWIDGVRLANSDGRDPKVLSHVIDYIVRCKGKALSDSEANDSFVRISEMLYANTKESLGDSLADQGRLWAERVRDVVPAAVYGDGRLAPYEWVRDPAGRILKTDSTGHDLDHTIVGKQSLLWDIAGFLVEWRMVDPATVVLQAVQARIDVPRATLDFYRMAYAAYRVGMTSLCATDLPQESAERSRLLRASELYRSQLESLLKLQVRTQKFGTPMAKLKD